VAEEKQFNAKNNQLQFAPISQNAAATLLAI